MTIFTRSYRLVSFTLLFNALFLASLIAGEVRLNNQPNHFEVVQNTSTGIRAVNSFSEFRTLEIKSPEGIFTRILVPSYARSGAYGQPELPVRSELVALPGGEGAQVVVLNSSYKEYALSSFGINYPLMPHQPPVPKTGEPDEFIYDQEAYRLDGYFPQEIASVEFLGSMRGVDIGRLDIFPVQYNPATGMIRVYEHMEIELVYGEGAQPGGGTPGLSSHYFTPVFRSLVNYSENENTSRENMTRYPVKYVIVSDPIFEQQLQPFIEWKRRKGFDVVEAYTNDPLVGATTSQIKAYLEGLYTAATQEDPAPSFVLFVGDINLVPTFTGQAASHVTDLYYCEYSGDYFPEIFYGRFSAQNPAQLQPQIDKTLMYEQYTMPVTSYLDTVVMIAGVDGTFGPTHGNGQINYGTVNYFNESNGIYSHTYLYPGSGSSAAAIRQNISDGVTFANYTAHGSPDGWADPSFTVGHIPALQNEGKYGVLVGNCCSTSEYQVAECFGEALLRAENKGAVGYIGASNSTYWDEDYYFGVGVGQIAGTPPPYEETTLGYYDRAFHTHGEPFPEWYTTADQMIFAGNLAVTQGSPGSAEYYWEAYCLMGDPSLMVYFAEPPAIEAVFNPLLPLGSPSFEVTAEPYSYVAISQENILYDAVLADSNGLAQLDVSGITTPGMADIVVTAQNFQPWQGEVLVANPEGPYVMMNQYLLHDPDNNGVVEMGEEVSVDMELKNWGNSDAVNVMATLVSSDEFITLTEDEADYGTIAAQDSVMQTGAYLFEVADFIPDQHEVMFDVLIQDGTRETWNSSFSVILNAPVMDIGSLAVIDTAGGNGNRRMDPGETVDLVLECHNAGHCDAYNIQTVMQSSSPYITFQNTSVDFDTIYWNGMQQAVFTVTLADSIEAGEMIELVVTQVSGPYADDKVFYPQVGLILEDFENGNFESYPWVHSGNQPWQTVTENTYEGLFSARSGAIGNNQSSVLMIDMDVAIDDSISFYRRVSCEDDPGGANYDWLAFYIDDTEIERWDGELGWGQVSYAVSAGQHTFKWVYSKDYSVVGGADAAWIDFIVFPAIAPMVSVDESPIKSGLAMEVYPNPASDRTACFINLPSRMTVGLEIYDITGKLVSDVLPAQTLPAGNHTIALPAGHLNPGVYFCTLRTGEQLKTKKLIITK